MNSIENHRVHPVIKPFVDSFNKRKDHKGFPIVAFQFVSLNAVENGKMVWWNYLHKNIHEKYLQAVSDFTGIRSLNANVERTLINWEYDKHSYWYAKLGAQPVVKNHKNEFLPVLDFTDESGVERNPADPTEKNRLLKVWKKILLTTFDKSGATMWMSIPHKDNLGHYIFSSVFCLFNKPIGSSAKRLLVSKSIRNFIINYLIDLYGQRFKKEIEALRTAIDINEYKPRGYNFTGDKVKKRVKELEERYFVSEYASEFATAHNDAKSRVLSTYDPDTGEFKNPNIKFPTAYKNISAVAVGHKFAFFQFIYGRAVILLFHIVFDMTLAKAFSLLKNKDESLLVLSDFQKMFGIDGLKSDTPGTSGKLKANIDLDKIILKISDAEFELLLAVCESLGKKNLRTDIQNVRKS